MTEYRIQLLKRLRDNGNSLLGLTKLSIEELESLLNIRRPEAADVIDPFIPYKEHFLGDVQENGFETTFLNWKCGNMCGCMGPRNGDPFCPCEMRSKTADMFGKVVEND